MPVVITSCDAEDANHPGELVPQDPSLYRLPGLPLIGIDSNTLFQNDTRSRVLLVEDDALIRENLEEILLLEGYEVVSAIDGLHALEILREQPAPDLVITDLQMPRANGWVLAMELRRDPRLANLPLVVISGVHDSRAAGGFLGASATFQKPFDVPAFLDTLERLLDPKQPNVQTDAG
jgi:CheY-like chemotaxis protein